MSSLVVSPARPVSVAMQKTMCEFFAGIGLVGEGLRASGWKCVYANDNEPKKQQLYEALNGKSAHFHLEDVGKTDEIIARIPGAPFLATASFPCIDLSLAGHYKGFAGSHSSTFFGFADVLQQLGSRRPRLVLLENVFGFIASRDGRDFAEATQALASLGYFLDCFVLDARSFVPQSRPRVFVVGMGEELLHALRTPRSGRQLEFNYSSVGESPINFLKASRLRPTRLVDLLKRVPLSTGWHPLSLPDPPCPRSSLLEFIDFDAEQDWWAKTQVDRHCDMLSELHRTRIEELRLDGDRHVATGFRRIRKGVQRLEVRFDGLAGCLRTPKGGSAKQVVVAIDKSELRMRWMSPREYARLQGVAHFPLSNGTRNQLLWGFGDAVCVPAVSWIDKQILTPLFEKSTVVSRTG